VQDPWNDALADDQHDRYEGRDLAERDRKRQRQRGRIESRAAGLQDGSQRR
jgi:hypothetical protein